MRVVAHARLADDVERGDDRAEHDRRREQLRVATPRARSTRPARASHTACRHMSRAVCRPRRISASRSERALRGAGRGRVVARARTSSAWSYAARPMPMPCAACSGRVRLKVAIDAAEAAPRLVERPRRRAGSRRARAPRRARSSPSRNRASPSCARSSAARSRGVPRSTTNARCPSRPSAGSTVAHTTTQSARAPFEQNIFAPESTHSSPSLRARVLDARDVAARARLGQRHRAPARARVVGERSARKRSRCSGVAMLRSAVPPRPGPGSDSATPRSQYARLLGLQQRAQWTPRERRALGSASRSPSPSTRLTSPPWRAQIR